MDGKDERKTKWTGLRVIHADPGVIVVLFQQSAVGQLKLSKVQWEENGEKARPQASVINTNHKLMLYTRKKA